MLYTITTLLLGMGKVTVDANKCERCGHVWLPRNAEQEPKVCPSCKSPYWNRPRRNEKKADFSHEKVK